MPMKYIIIFIPMGKISDKFKSWYLWGNLLAMAIVVVLMIVGVAYGLDRYTHHGESIAVPDVKYKSVGDARQLLSELGLESTVSDTGYVKSRPADCVLEVSPQVGSHVKSGHLIRLIVNASKSPTLTLPDLIDNCSLREAMARLQAMGFKVGLPEYVSGERDWVYGIKAGNKNLEAGDRVSVDSRLTVVVGNGLPDENDSINYVSPQPDSFYEGLFDEDDGTFEED